MHPEIVAEAREWLRTPFAWQASLKGVGCDCKGLVVGVVRELGRPEAKSLHARMSAYSRVVPEHDLRTGLAANLQRVTEPQLGDVLLMKIGGRAVHLGFFCGDDVIHTYGKGPRMVLPHPFATVLRHFPLDSIWRFA